MESEKLWKLIKSVSSQNEYSLTAEDTMVLEEFRITENQLKEAMENMANPSDIIEMWKD